MNEESSRYDCLKLDNQLCFPLYVCAKEVVNRYTPYLSELGLTYTQYVTMMVVWEEKSVLSRRLKERLFLDSGTLTPVLRRLEEKGLIAKRRSEEDARDLVVTLTEAGEALKNRAVLVPEQVAACIHGLPEPDKLQQLLRELMGAFAESRQCSGASKTDVG